MSDYEGDEDFLFALAMSRAETVVPSAPYEHEVVPSAPEDEKFSKEDASDKKSKKLKKNI